MENKIFREEAIAEKSAQSIGRVLYKVPPNFHWYFLTILLVSILICIFIFFVNIPSQITSKAEIIPREGIYKITSPHDGFIKSIFINELAGVNIGERLLKVKLTEKTSDVLEYENKKIAILKEDIASLKQQRDRLDSLYQLEKGNIKKKIKEGIGKIDANQKVIDQQRKILLSAEKEYKKFHEFSKKKLITTERKNSKYNYFLNSKKEYLRLLQKAKELESELEQLHYEQKRIGVVRESGILQLEDRIREVNRDLIQLQSGDSFTIKTHMKGIAYFNDIYEGKSVTKDDELLTILPSKSDLIARIQIKEKYRYSILVGQEVILEFEALPKNEYGLFKAVITEIDSLSNVNNDDEDAEYNKFFYVSARLDSIGNDVEIIPGMTAKATIVTKERRLFDILK